MITPADLAAMRAVVSARWRADGPYVEQHLGDLAWGANPPGGGVRAILFGDDAYAFVDGDAWHCGARPGADARFAEIAAAARSAGATVTALERETAKVAALRAAGFVPDESAWFWHLVIDLADLPPVTLPPGASVREGASDPEARVAVHRAAWEPSRFTREPYDAVRATPPYREDLDVAVVAPDGTWAAYCLGWLDEESGFGEMEPVGTAPAFRRQGYGAAACLTSLHRMRDLGATAAVVYAVSDPLNPGPRALYESLGFVARDRHVRYRPPMRHNSATEEANS